VDRITICLSSVVIAFGALTHASQAGQVINMRQCPLDALTFVDPVAGAEFTVTRVGTNSHYLCDSGPTDIPPADEQCSGPFGDLVLQGNDSEPDALGTRKVLPSGA